MLLTVVCYVAYVVNLFLLLVTLPFIMSLKRKSIQTASSDKKRKVITLETKYEMIKLYEGGETINSISKKFDMSTSTVSTIMKAIVGSVVEWLTHRTDDQHGLGSKPTCAILLCSWERHFTALSPAWWS